MGIARETFLQKLKADFYQKQSDSVIYQFIKQENERLYEQSKTEKTPRKHSSTTQLLGHLEKLSSGEEPPEEYMVHLLRILKARPQLYQDSTICEGSSSYPPTVPAPQLLYELLCTCLGQANAASPAARTFSPIPSKSRIHQLLEQVLLLLEEQEPSVLQNLADSAYVREPYEKLTLLTERVLECAICVEVKAYFYDAGSPYNADDYGFSDGTPSFRRSGSSAKKEKPRKADKTLSILDAYCERSGLSLFQSAHEPTMAECETLFELLVEGDNTQILIPLRIDGLTGCALYIMGRDYFEDLQSSRQSAPYACAYGILRQSTDSPIGHVLLDFFNPDLSIEEALADYELEKSDALAELSSLNQYLPAGTPESFLVYGYGITERERAEAKKNLDFEFEKFLKAADDVRRPAAFSYTQ